MILLRSTAVGLLLALVWVYLAVVFSPIWAPYKAINSAGRLSHSLGLI